MAQVARKDDYAKRKEENDKKIEEAMKAREERNSSSAKTSSSSTTSSSSSYAERKKELDSQVNTAMAARSKRIQNSASSIASDIKKGLTVEIDSYKKTQKPAFGSYSDTYKSQRERRLNISNLRSKVEAYRSYLNGVDADSILAALDEMEKGYDSYLYLSKFKDESAYNKAVEEQKAYEAMPTYDTKKGAKEIAELEKQAKADEKEYWNLYDLRTQYSYGATLGQQDDISMGIEARMQEILDKYGAKDIKDIQNQITKKKQYLTQAERLQEGLRLGSVGDKDSEYYDPEYAYWANTRDKLPTREDLVAYDSMMDQSKWYTDANGNLYDAFGTAIDPYNTDAKGNIQHPSMGSVDSSDKLGIFLAASEEDVQEASGTYLNTGGTWETIVAEGSQRHWDRMKESEINTYYYYLNKEGNEAAEKYLDSIQETLNRSEGTEMFNAMKDKTALELLFKAAVGLDQWGSSMQGMRNSITGNDEYTPVSATQYAGSLVQEDLGDVGFKIPEWMSATTDEYGNPVRTSIAQVAGDFLTTGANMLPSILTGMAVNAIAPGAGIAIGGKTIAASTIAGNAVMGASAYGGAYNEMINFGYDKDQSRTYASLVGASEVVLQSLLGGISQLGGGVIDDGITKALGKADNVLAKLAIQFGDSSLGKVIVNAFEEGSEEYIQAILEPWFKNIVFGEENKIDLLSEEALYSALLGMMTGGAFEGAGVAADIANTNTMLRDTGKAITAADGGVDALKALAMDVSGANPKLTAQANKVSSEPATGEGLVGKAVAAVKNSSNQKKVGKLYQAVVAEVSKQNQADIAKALNENGFSKSSAKNIAEAVVAKATGAELNKFQEAVLDSVKNNKKADEIVTKIINDPESGVSKRTGNIDTYSMGIMLGKGISPEATREAQKTSLKVSEEGKTTVNGKEIDVKFADNGMLATADGTVTVSDAEYSTATEAYVVETIANLGLKADAANSLFRTVNAKGMNDVQAQGFALGLKTAYNMGRIGNLAELHKNYFTSKLTAEQRETAYSAGLRERNAEASAKQENLAKNKDKATAESIASKKSGVYYRANDLNVSDIDTYLEKTEGLSDMQKTAVETMKYLSEALGTEFYVYESYEKDGARYYIDENGVEQKGAPNGWYDKATGKIYIDLHAGASARGTMLFTIAHELTHFIHQWSPAKFNILADIVVSRSNLKGEVSQRIQEKMRKAKERGNPISYELAYEEVIADSMETILKSGRVMEMVADIKQQDRGLWQKICDWFKKIADYMKRLVAAYEGVDPDSYEGKTVTEVENIIRELEKVFAEGLVDASENFHGTEKNTTQDGGEVVYQKRKQKKLEDKYYARQIDQWDGEDHGGSFRVCSPSDALLDVGIPDVDIWFDQSKASKQLKGKVEVDKNVLKAIPGILQNPTVIAESYDNSVVIFGKLHDKFGHPIVVALRVNSTNRRNHITLVNKVRSVGTRNTDLDKLLAESAILYLNENKKETNQWFNALGRSTPFGGTKFGLIRSITFDLPNVNKNSTARTESTENLDVEVDKKTGSVAPTVLKSERTWTESDYVQERDKAAKEIAKAIGVSEKKAKAYIDSVNSIAKMIADDRTRLDYFSSPGRSSFVSNVEYGGSFDFSTLCKKRRLLTGTFTAIQKALPNTALTANEILDIRNRMKDAGLEVSCGLCYVEGSRANMGQFAKEFLKLYKQYYPDAWQPNMADVNTPDGIEWVRINHPEVYEQYEYFWNHYGTLKPGDKNLFASQQKPKLYQLHTEYKGEVLEKFNDDDNVEEKNLNGGIRLQSFSDFEIVHLIDTMQIIMDMSRVGLAGQAYTKVPDFAWALGDTGLKINLSLIAKGVDENGKLIFDDVEGMPIETAVKLRNRYSKNVGTILVAFNDEQLLAAMADERVDFIIPFHRSQWKKSQYAAMGLPAKTKDYTYMQNEKFIKPQYHEYRGRMVKDKATNYMPNEYWDFSKSGKENAEAYLEMCARNNKRPKFYKLLQNNGDGSYSLKADGSTDGYWKLLIDFKMYDNNGNGSPQMPVKPDFNMDEATRMLNDYSGGHSNFPVAQGIVDDFVKQYKDGHKGVMFSDRDYIDAVNRGDMETAQKMVDATAKKAGYTLEVYHGTDAKFNIFGIGDIGFHSGTREQAEARREYMEADANRWNVNKLYSNISNPLVVEYDIGDWSAPEVAEHIIESRLIDDLTDDEIRWLQLLRYRDDNVVFGNQYNASASEDLRSFLREKGYDGIKYINAYEGSTEDWSYVAFEPNQYKSADPVTYDDKGNVIPLSERFKAENNDIRYSERDNESVSTRSLLANAFESVAQNEKEQEKLSEYKAKIAFVNAKEQRLREINAKLFQSNTPLAKGERIKLQDEAVKLRNQITIYDSQLLRLEASKPLQNVLNREKAKVRKQMKEQAKKDIQEAKLEEQQRYKNRVANHDKVEMRKKIRKTIRELDKILNHGDKKKNVKDDMKGLVSSAIQSAEVLFTENYSNEDIIQNGFGVQLGAEEQKHFAEAQNILQQIFNLGTGYEAMAEREKLKNKLSYRMAQLREAFFRERNRLNETRVSEVLGNLADAYSSLESSEHLYIKDAYHASVHEYLKYLQTDVGGTTVRNMSMSQLENLHKAYTMVLETVRNANKMFNEKLKEGRDQLANAIMREVRMAGGEHGDWTKGGIKRNKFSWNNMKPIYAAERIGSETFSRVVNGLFEGQYKWATTMDKAREFQVETAQKYGVNNWDMEQAFKFTSSNDLEFTLNLEQILALYAYSKRDAAHDHITNGGIVFGKNTEVVENKHGIKVHKLKRSATTYSISDTLLGEIISKLDDSQKKYVDEMQKYLSETMGGLGNEVSMKLYGVKLFGEENYFPLRSAGQYMEKAREADLQKQQGHTSLVNSGFTHAVKPHAKNPIVLDGFMDVWAGHVNEMAMYNGMVLPMEDFRKVYNYHTPFGDGSTSVNGVIENAYGAEATNYFDQLYQELNSGALSDPRESDMLKWVGKFKKAAVMMSMSVVVQQPSAIGRAFALIDPKYFVGQRVSESDTKKQWVEVKKYAPVAIIKEMGGFDTHTGASAKDFLLAKEYSKDEIGKALKDKEYLKEKADMVMGYLPAKADELTWVAIWQAVKREVKAKNPSLHGEEFLKKAGDRFSEVIEKTQVYDSILARSANMRAKTGLMTMATAFMAEPTTTINMVENAFRSKKNVGRVLASVVTSIILNNILASVIYAIRDDDEDETFLEKYAQAFTSGMVDDLNPVTYYPFLKDVWSIFQGYDVERSDMSVIADVSDALKKVVQILGKDTSEMDEDELAEHHKEIWSAALSLADGAFSAVGVPFKNTRREVESWINAYRISKSGIPYNGTSLLKTIAASAVDALPVVSYVWKTEKSDKLYDAISSGNTAYEERLRSEYEDEKQIANAIRKGLRENDSRIYEAALAQINGRPEERVKLQRQVIADGFKQDDVVSATNSIISKLSPSTSTSEPKKKGLYDTEDFALFVSGGNTDLANEAKQDIIATHQLNGKTVDEAEKSFRSSAKTDLKEMFLAGTVTVAAAEHALKTYCDMDDTDAKTTVNEWNYFKNTGVDYSDKKEKYISGELSAGDLVKALASVEGKTVKEAASTVVSYTRDAYEEGYFTRSQAASVMMSYGGLTSAEADSKLRYIDVKKQLPDTYVDDAWVEEYYKEVQSSGISINVFVDYRNQVKSITGEGKKERRMAVINSMPISNAQKDALYYAEGWAASRLYEAPWR